MTQREQMLKIMYDNLHVNNEMGVGAYVYGFEETVDKIIELLKKEPKP